MKLPLYQLDAFTSRLFGGNPAAVVLLEEWLPDNVLAAIAAENNLAETAFVIPNSDVTPLRWFTPTVEVDLCGHATLATADVLFRYRFPRLDRLRFSTRSGKLAVSRAGNLLEMDFPSRPGKPVEVTDALATALGARPREARLALFRTGRRHTGRSGDRLRALPADALLGRATRQKRAHGAPGFRTRW